MKGIALTFARTAEGSSWRTAIADTAAEKALVVIRQFKLTPEITDGYAHMIGQYNASSKADKLNKKAFELAVIAKHEQLRVLRPLIYNDM